MSMCTHVYELYISCMYSFAVTMNAPKLHMHDVCTHATIVFSIHTIMCSSCANELVHVYTCSFAVICSYIHTCVSHILMSQPNVCTIK